MIVEGALVLSVGICGTRPWISGAHRLWRDVGERRWRQTREDATATQATPTASPSSSTVAWAELAGGYCVSSG